MLRKKSVLAGKSCVQSNSKHECLWHLAATIKSLLKYDIITHKMLPVPCSCIWKMHIETSCLMFPHHSPPALAPKYLWCLQIIPVHPIKLVFQSARGSTFRKQCKITASHYITLHSQPTQYQRALNCNHSKCKSKGCFTPSCITSRTIYQGLEWRVGRSAGSKLRGLPYEWINRPFYSSHVDKKLLSITLNAADYIFWNLYIDIIHLAG